MSRTIKLHPHEFNDQSLVFNVETWQWLLMPLWLWLYYLITLLHTKLCWFMCQGRSTSINLSANLPELICSVCSSCILHPQKFLFKPSTPIKFYSSRSSRSKMRTLTKESKLLVSNWHHSWSFIFTAYIYTIIKKKGFDTWRHCHFSHQGYLEPQRISVEQNN